MSEEELRQYLIDEIDLQKEFLNQHEVGFIREDEEERLSALETALNLIDKQKEEIDNLKLKIQQKEITAEAFKNALGEIVKGQKWCKDIEGGTTIYINPNENLSDEELDDLIKVYTEWEKEGIGFKKIRTRAILGLLNTIKKQRKETEQLADGIRVLGTNPDITTDEIIKRFTEKPISEEYMKKFKNSYKGE